MTRFQIIEWWREIEQGYRTGYLTAREYRDAQVERQEAWDAMLRRERGTRQREEGDLVLAR